MLEVLVTLGTCQSIENELMLLVIDRALGY